MYYYKIKEIVLTELNAVPDYLLYFYFFILAGTEAGATFVYKIIYTFVINFRLIHHLI